MENTRHLFCRGVGVDRLSFSTNFLGTSVVSHISHLNYGFLIAEELLSFFSRANVLIFFPFIVFALFGFLVSSDSLSVHLCRAPHGRKLKTKYVHAVHVPGHKK